MAILLVFAMLSFAGISMWAQGGFNPPSGGSGVTQVTTNPSGACTVGAPMQYNSTSPGSLWGCAGGVWTVSGGSLGFTPLNRASNLSDLASAPTALQNIGAAPDTGASFTFWVSGGTTFARNNVTMSIDYSGTDAAGVINQALATLVSTGGTLYFRNGTYNFNSATQETVSPYSHYYCVGIPSANGTQSYDFHFIGESEQNVVFNVTSTAITAAGSGHQLDAFWSRPNTNHSLGFYWGNYVYFTNASIRFPDNTRANQHGIDMFETAYLEMRDVNAGFITDATALGATNNTAFVTPATFSDGTFLLKVVASPGWSTGFEVDTEHSVIVNSIAYKATIGVNFAANENRNAQPINHSGQFIHLQIFDCVHGIVVGQYVSQGVQLDIVGLDIEYTNSGNWAYVDGFVTGTSGSKNLVGGFLSWDNILTGASVQGSLTTPFPSGYGTAYTVEKNGSTNGMSPATQTLLSSLAADNIIGNFTGSTAVPGTQALPACAADGSHALTYPSHTLTCTSVTAGGITLTTTGSSGAATYTGGTLNIPIYSSGGTASTTYSTLALTPLTIANWSTLGTGGTRTDLSTGGPTGGGAINISGTVSNINVYGISTTVSAGDFTHYFIAFIAPATFSNSANAAILVGFTDGTKTEGCGVLSNSDGSSMGALKDSALAGGSYAAVNGGVANTSNYLGSIVMVRLTRTGTALAGAISYDQGISYQSIFNDTVPYMTASSIGIWADSRNGTSAPGRFTLISYQ